MWVASRSARFSVTPSQPELDLIPNRIKPSKSSNGNYSVVSLALRQRTCSAGACYWCAHGGVAPPATPVCLLSGLAGGRAFLLPREGPRCLAPPDHARQRHAPPHLKRANSTQRAAPHKFPSECFATLCDATWGSFCFLFARVWSVGPGKAGWGRVAGRGSHGAALSKAQSSTITYSGRHSNAPRDPRG